MDETTLEQRLAEQDRSLAALQDYVAQLAASKLRLVEADCALAAARQRRAVGDARRAA